MKKIIERTRSAGIPQDVQCGDVDIQKLIGLDFSVSPTRFAGLANYVVKLKERGVRFMPYVEPFIMMTGRRNPALESGNKLDVWTKKADGKTDFVGKAWWVFNAKWPDFTLSRTRVSNSN